MPHVPSRTGGVPIQYHVITGSNYGLLAVKMKILLRPFGVWLPLEGKGEFDPCKDDNAIAALSRFVPDLVRQSIIYHIVKALSFFKF